MTRLSSLQRAELDTAFADAQLRLQTAVLTQDGACSQNGKSGPLRRYAQQELPKSRAFLELCQAAGRRSLGSRAGDEVHRGCKPRSAVRLGLSSDIA
jgi:hypothetical protein